MNKKNEEEGKEGDEPKIEEFDEEKENEETKKNMKKGKKVFHEWEPLHKNKLLKVVDVPVVQVVIWTRSLTCPLCATTGVSATVKVPQIQFIAESELCSWQPGAAYGDGGGDDGAVFFFALLQVVWSWAPG